MEPHINYDIPAVIRRRPFPQELASIRAPARLLDPNWQYTRAAETDILKTFKRMGWVPPTEQALRDQLLRAGWMPPHS